MPLIACSWILAEIRFWGSPTFLGMYTHCWALPVTVKMWVIQVRYSERWTETNLISTSWPLIYIWGVGLFSWTFRNPLLCYLSIGALSSLLVISPMPVVYLVNLSHIHLGLLFKSPSIISLNTMVETSNSNNHSLWPR